MATSGSSCASHSRTGMDASKSGFHAGSCVRLRSTTGPTDGTCESPIPPTILDGIFELSRREELLIALAAHLGAHPVEAVAGDRADLEEVVDIRAGLDQAAEIALANEVLLFL